MLTDDSNYERLLNYLKDRGYESYHDYFVKHRPSEEYYSRIYFQYPDNHLNWDLTDELGQIFCPEKRAHGYLLYYLATVICTEGNTLADLRTIQDNFRQKMRGKPYTPTPGEFSTALKDLHQEKLIHIEGQCVWHYTLWHYEKTITDVMKRTSEMRPLHLQDADIFRGDLTEAQFGVLKSVTDHRIVIMDGLPGTGKTHACSNIVNYLEQHGVPVWLLAPTGLAAKNLSDRCSRPARTLHSFVMLSETGSDGNDVAFLIDEFSMVDVRIFSQLVSKVFQECDPIFIFVGDTGQLPSIGPGQIFKELIELKDKYGIAYHRLEKIVRQQEGSEIIQNAHSIRFGKTDIINKNQFQFAETDEHEASDSIIKAATKLKTAGKVCGRDFVVLSPTHKGQCGVAFLNEKLREIFNPHSYEKYETNNGMWREGDLVLINQNFYNLGLVNGDIGTIKEINNERSFVIKLFDREVRVTKEVIKTLKHAYALTIHKSQGQEFPIVIMPFVNSFTIQLQRKLLYTGITRAKEKVIIFGHRAALNKAINTSREEYRKTGLKTLAGLMDESRND